MDLIILDTGDNYILALKDKNYETALALYTMMDITVNQIETGYKLNDETAQFIFLSIGRIISYGFNDTDGSIRMDIPMKLIEDIGKTIGFYKTKRFWSGIASKEKDLMLIKNEDIRGPPVMSGFDNIYNKLNDLIEYHIDTPKQSELSKLNTYVVYNTIYNISLVIQCDVTLEKSFPEFQVSLQMPNTNTEPFMKHFHKVSFGSREEILTKYEAFKTLYNIGKDKSIENEKDKLQRLLESSYDISDNPDQRMKANDLYKDLINFLIIPYNEVSLFKKRAAGYLLELGLQKKRYADAYYYYGIVKKEQVTMSLSELEKKRDVERKDWFFKRHESSTDKLKLMTDESDDMLRNRLAKLIEK